MAEYGIMHGMENRDSDGPPRAVVFLCVLLSLTADSAAALRSTTPSAAGTPLDASTERDAAELIARAATAHGGAARIAAVERMLTEWRVTDIWVRQSRRPDPPWQRSVGLRRYAIDLGARRFFEYVRQEFAGGYPFHYRAVVDGPRSELRSYIDCYRRALPAADYATRSAALRHAAPVLLVRALLEQPARARRLPAETIDERPVERLRFDWTDDETVDLAFDAESYRLIRLSQPIGSGHVQEYVFDDYAVQDGLATPERFSLYYDGGLVWEVDIVSVSYDAAFDSLFEPDETLPRMDIDVPASVRDFAVREIADGVYFIGGGVEYQLFVELDEFVVAIGSVGGVERRLAALRERIGAKPLRYAMVSHHHSDHLEGVPALVDAGAILLTAPGHVDVVRAAAGERSVRIEPVAERRRLGEGARAIEILAIGPNAHAEQMLAGWLPGAALLYTADLFVQPPERPIRAAIEPIYALAEEIERRALPVEHLVDPHSPRINSRADLRASLQRAASCRGDGWRTP